MKYELFRLAQVSHVFKSPHSPLITLLSIDNIGNILTLYDWTLLKDRKTAQEYTDRVLKRYSELNLSHDLSDVKRKRISNSSATGTISDYRMVVNNVYNEHVTSNTSESHEMLN